MVVPPFLLFLTKTPGLQVREKQIRRGGGSAGKGSHAQTPAPSGKQDWMLVVV